MRRETTIEVAESLDAVDPQDWDRLAQHHPLVSHAFLHALHESGSASEDTGWTPRYLLMRESGALIGAMPLYLKDHSYGEYVFDWAWADAWHRAGGRYYPKLLTALPFTPVTGPRLLAETPQQRRQLANAARQLVRELEVSSWHCLFPTETEAQELEADGFVLRQTVQFHWRNDSFENFDAFLARMNHDKRKKIKQERRKVREQGVSFVWKVGNEISESDWRFFLKCYNNTYREHHSSPYLNLDFFLRIAASMPNNLMLAIGARDSRPMCSSLLVFDDKKLFGRYWGTLEFVPGLHFETCYYQSIEFCIARGIEVFEGGAQGEHKLARGLMPVTTYSAHWIEEPRFADAIKKFLSRESKGIHSYVNELEEHTPFKRGDPGED